MNKMQQFFQNDKLLSPESILSQARGRIKNSLKNEDFDALESYLNAIFYPSQKDSKIPIEKLQTAVVQSLESKFQEAYDSYDFSTNIGNAKNISNNKYKIGVGMYDAESHSSYIYVNTLKQRMIQLNNQLEKIRNEEDAKIIIQQMELLLEQIQLFLDKAGASIEGTNIKKIQINKPGQEEFRDLLSAIDKGWQAVTFYDSLPFPNWKSGEVFEQALQTTSKGLEFLIQSSEEEILQAFKTKTAGSGIQQRGTLSLKTETSLNITENEVKDESGNSNYQYNIVGKDGSKFTLSGTFSGKQGKMDVLYTMPNGSSAAGKVFRISAKNWSTLNNTKDFGETSMLNAILRTTGTIDSAFAYGIQANYPNTLRNARAFGRACLVVDILMGYSQINGYADTIVINDRTAGKPQIHVYSISNILNKVEGSIHLDNYLRVESGTYDDFKVDYSSHLDTQLLKIWQGLSTYKLSVTANILKL